MDTHNNLFLEIISLENLFDSWEEFKSDKRKKYDVQVFEKNLEYNLFSLQDDLKTKSYHHSDYTSFYITDPKLRHIHKAEVRDRIVHHAIYRVLYPIFDKGFIYDSYSCRLKKGTHKAVDRLKSFTRKVSHNNTKPCYVLKCDIKKFFDSINHEILLKIIRRRITNHDTLWLIEEVIRSFSMSSICDANRERERERERDSAPQISLFSRSGLPIGNLTSQLLANIYLNELDQFVKHKLKIKYYLRYCDDFVFTNTQRENLEDLIPVIEQYLNHALKLRLHQRKVIMRKLKQGVDFLGFVVLLHHRVLRMKTKKRMFSRVNKKNLSSYLGLIQHCNGHKLKQTLVSQFPLP